MGSTIYRLGLRKAAKHKGFLVFGGLFYDYSALLRLFLSMSIPVTPIFLVIISLTIPANSYGLEREGDIDDCAVSAHVSFQRVRTGQDHARLAKVVC